MARDTRAASVDAQRMMSAPGGKKRNIRGSTRIDLLMAWRLHWLPARGDHLMTARQLQYTPAA